jgi:hypothetical protein
LAVGQWYDFPEFGGYLGKVGCDLKNRWVVSFSSGDIEKSVELYSEHGAICSSYGTARQR